MRRLVLTIPLGIALALAALTGAPSQQRAPDRAPEPRAWPTYSTPPIAERFGGVAHVIDGDGLRVAGRDVRLQGIDAPEWDQMCGETDGVRAWSCGQAARQRLRELAQGRLVECVTPSDDPVDSYGRRLAFCRAGAVDLNLALLEEGLAVAFRRFLGTRPHAAAYVAAEDRARAARRGMWRGPFRMPWDHRASRRG